MVHDVEVKIIENEPEFREKGARYRKEANIIIMWTSVGIN
jgi:hypothetical protein